MEGTRFRSSKIRERDEYFFDFIINTNLFSRNRGSKPTFHFPGLENYDGYEKILDDSRWLTGERIIRDLFQITVGYFWA